MAQYRKGLIRPETWHAAMRLTMNVYTDPRIFDMAGASVPGNVGVSDGMMLTLSGGGDRQQKTPSGMDGVFKRAKGVEPSTFTLAT